jgi:hypothetical protein
VIKAKVTPDEMIKSSVASSEKKAFQQTDRISVKICDSDKTVKSSKDSGEVVI